MVGVGRHGRSRQLSRPLDLVDAGPGWADDHDGDRHGDRLWDGSDSVTFRLDVTNAAPEAWTIGPKYVPSASVSDRVYRWSARDVGTDVLDTTADCGAGAVTATGDWYVDGVKTLRCHFAGAGSTKVGVRSTDSDGATTDARLGVVATPNVLSVSDGAIRVDGPAGGDQLGGALATPDLNGDHRADVAIGSSLTSSGPTVDPGYVAVVLGRTGTGALQFDGLPGGARSSSTGQPMSGSAAPSRPPGT